MKFPIYDLHKNLITVSASLVEIKNLVPCKFCATEEEVFHRADDMALERNITQNIMGASINIFRSLQGTNHAPYNALTIHDCIAISRYVEIVFSVLKAGTAFKASVLPFAIDLPMNVVPTYLTTLNEISKKATQKTYPMLPEEIMEVINDVRQKALQNPENKAVWAEIEKRLSPLLDVPDLSEALIAIDIDLLALYMYEKTNRDPAVFSVTWEEVR